MKKTLRPVLLILGLMLYLSPIHSLLAQISPRSGSAACGIIELTPAQAMAFKQQATLAFKRKLKTNKALSAITYVPIRPHIVRRSNGTDGYTLGSINRVLAATNRYYLQHNMGIQFFFAGSTPDYVDNDALYASFPRGGEGEFVDSHDSHEALNQYYANNIEKGFGGYAYYPADNLQSTRSVIQTYAQTASDTYVGNYVLPHELGHNFGLIHTHGIAEDGTPTQELVTRGPGANCETTGDLICDTPADPYGMPGFSYTYLDDGCYQYNPESTPRDANGDPYTPMTTNAMSYYLTMSCTHDFTPGQAEHMQQGLALRQSHTSYSLTAPPTPVNPPTNLIASFNGVSIVLSWQDNADNEMGYFIERSTLPTTGFVPVSGVAPDETTFTDEEVTPATQYYYRIRPSNTTTDNLSSTIAIATCPPPLYAGASPNRTSARLFWNSQPDQPYTVRWRAVGNAPWNTVSALNNMPYSLTGLTSQTAYEWQIRVDCSPTASSNFTDLQSFTTIGCQLPSYAFAFDLISKSVQFAWSTPMEDPGRTTEIRYRIVGSPTWTTVSGLASPATYSTYSLTGLTSNTSYEWQLRNVCSASENSDFTNLASFKTMPPSPDLTPILYARPTIVYGTANYTVVVDVVELSGIITNGSFTVKITKDVKVNLSFPTSATSVGGRTVQNGAWVFNGDEPNYYVLTTSQSIAAGDKLSVGLTGVLSPGATTGKLSVSAILLPTGMIEASQSNNADADKIEYFQQ